MPFNDLPDASKQKKPLGDNAVTQSTPPTAKVYSFKPRRKRLLSVDESRQNQKVVRISSRLRDKGIYLFPNAITTLALFCGFYGIVQAMSHHFDIAASAIFMAMLFDSLDGRVARLTNTQSAFGAEYDSLSDMVSFGAAPALVVYQFALQSMGKIGWLAAFVYLAGAALRLARFNTNIEVVDKRFFQGLPSPAAAGLVVGLIWVLQEPWIQSHWSAVIQVQDQLCWVMTMFAGLTMVSNVSYYSFKDFDIRKSVPFVVVFGVVLAITLYAQNPPVTLFLTLLGYGLSGYIYTARVWWLQWRQS
jgi:CDP-diacylglycerol--serine O-phosphatidyltransferase